MWDDQCPHQSNYRIYDCHYSMWVSTSNFWNPIWSSLHLESKHIKSKTFKWLIFGFIPNHASYRVLFLTTYVGVWFRKYTNIYTTSAQKFLGTFLWSNIDQVISVIVQFLFSTTPFYWWVYGVVRWCLISYLSKKLVNLLEQNFLP